MNDRSPAVIGFTAVALLAAPSLSATATTHSSPTTHAAAPASIWGPYYSPGGKRARASGTITPIGENHETLPSAATLTVSGTVSDLTRGSACGWAVFGIATINAAGTRVDWTHHPVRTCVFHAAKKFSFTYHRVYQVDLKVCSERRASKPSIQCTAGNPAWRTLYTSPR
ncbi:hypothetical protein [Nonomuraea fuscirosea]|uniref:hypothetical protein n=1 Tax=Nonomuraea fuscirosea TaxID=1291556 RepID=UPI0034238C35